MPIFIDCDDVRKHYHLIAPLLGPDWTMIRNLEGDILFVRLTLDIDDDEAEVQIAMKTRHSFNREAKEWTLVARCELLGCLTDGQEDSFTDFGGHVTIEKLVETLQYAYDLHIGCI